MPQVTWENLGTSSTAGWELTTHSKTRRLGWSQRGPSAHGGLKPGCNAEPLDPTHGWPDMSASLSTVAAEGLPGKLQVRWVWKNAAQWALQALDKGEPRRLMNPAYPAVHEPHIPQQCSCAPRVCQWGTVVTLDHEQTQYGMPWGLGTSDLLAEW